MKILNHRQIQQKIKRIAYEIYERNFEEQELILIGINQRGMEVARLILEELLKIADGLIITVSRVQLSPQNPLMNDILLEMPIQELEGKTIVVVDDVANTGKTLFYAMRPMMAVLPKKIETAVLVDRMHKSFPIRTDYVGLSLATTIAEHIFVDIIDAKEYAAYLQN